MALRNKLLGPEVTISRTGWIVFSLITLLAGVLRMWNLSHPDRLIFDETYYVKDGWALWNFGYEVGWPEDADDAFVTGNPMPNEEASYVVHPPLGKWLIGAGMMIFGTDNGFGWRFTAALAGTIMVALFILLVTKMLASQFFGGIAGILLAVEGHHIVMSRTALLDIFMAMFVLAAFLALVYDRSWHRKRLLHDVENNNRSRSFVSRLWRPWWIVAAILIGAATAVKLSALAFVAAFAVLTLVWDWRARVTLDRHGHGSGRAFVETLTKDWFPTLLLGIPVFALTYLLSWSGWLATDHGWGRGWAELNEAQGLQVLIPDWLRSLTNYHLESTRFHTGLDSEHSYASTPWTWWFMGRPTSFFYEGAEHGVDGCVHERCSAAITDLANPLLWWAGAIAFFVVVYIALAKNDWRAWSVIAGYGAGFFVWLLFPNRTMFFFYTVAYEVFLILAVLLTLRLVMRRLTPAGSPTYSKIAVTSALTFVVLVVAVSAYFWPIWTGEQISYDQWQSRMWLNSWI